MSSSRAPRYATRLQTNAIDRKKYIDHESDSEEEEPQLYNKDFLAACTADVPLKFLKATKNCTLLYMILFFSNEINDWLLKWGYTDCTIEERLAAHRNTYRISDREDQPSIIVLRLIECGTASRHEADINKNPELKRLVRKVRNWSKPGSMHVEQTDRITEAFVIIDKYCEAQQQLYEEGELTTWAVWDSDLCEVCDNNGIVYNGHTIREFDE